MIAPVEDGGTRRASQVTERRAIRTSELPTRMLGNIRLQALAALILGTLLASVTTWAQELHFSFSPKDDDSVPAIFIKGEIALGDTQRLQAFLHEHATSFIEQGGSAVLSIDGGDVLEAFELGKLIREAMIEIRLSDAGRARCVSACFFIFASAVSRVAVAGTVGVHRPHIAAESLARSTPAQVRERYAGLALDTTQRLEALQIPRDVIEHLLRTPSNETYWLSRDELDLIGETTPWFDDYSAAKCGAGPALSARLRRAEAAGYELEAAALREEIANARACLKLLKKQQRQKLVDEWSHAIKP